jgi:hypothetical protein
VVFQTRWAMNYLTGPLTPVQIPELNILSGTKFALSIMQPSFSQPASINGQTTILETSQLHPIIAPPATISGDQAIEYSSTRPAIPAGIDEYFLPNNLTISEAFKAFGDEIPTGAVNQGMVYFPVILSQASARLFNLKYKLNIDVYKTALVENPDRRGIVRWDNFPCERIDPSQLDQAPVPQARFSSPDTPLNDVKLMNSLQKDFLDWTYRYSEVMIRANEQLKLFAEPQISEAEFRTQCSNAARQACEAELKKASATFDSKLRTLNDRLEREQRELEQDKSELSSRKLETGVNVAETLFGLLGQGRKRAITSSITKARMTSQAKGDVEESIEAIKDIQAQIAVIETEKAVALQAVNDKWGAAANQITEIPISAQKKDILLDFFGVAWIPYHLVKVGEQVIKLPGFSVK